jgi:LmbE family N-acetylglucosaminyl deacetylase
MRNTAPDLQRFSRVLVVFPHPDDETVSCGGTIRRLADAGAQVTLMLLTGGERGTPSGALDQQLQAIRQDEAQRAARILGISEVVHEEFPDGHIVEHASQVSSSLAKVIARFAPDLIVTYDRAGLDGHPDHIACSDIVTELARTRFPRVTVWYSVLPTWILTIFFLIGQLRSAPHVKARRTAPTLRVPIAPSVSAKLRAWEVHASQLGRMGKGLGRVVPRWVVLRAWPFEYFAELA